MRADRSQARGAADAPGGISGLEKAELRSEIFDCIEIFQNRRRRHSTLGYRPPADCESSTLGSDGTRGAASRLITDEKMTTTAQAATINA
jgi:hypothetical protein